MVFLDTQVTRIAPFGAFVAIEDFPALGLINIGQVRGLILYRICI
jgi:predicted RNA-binding protein with RPS1 domain